jgi:hypothetical protein
MNLGFLFLLFVIIIGAVMGLTLISAKTPTGITDTYGQTMGNESNASQAAVGNLTATGGTVGTGALLLVVGIIGATIFGLLVLVAARKI